MADHPEGPRRLPIGFSIVGVQKAATSSLYFFLSRHRQVARGRKEWHFFDDEAKWANGPRDYTAYANDAQPWEVLAGDATPSYLYWPRALERIRDYRPEMRLIASFRDPIERAFSQWSMEFSRFPDYPDFATAIAGDPFDALPERVPDGMGLRDFRRRTLVSRGWYAAQVRRGLTLFPREQWLMLDFRQLTTARDATLALVADHLGLKPFHDIPDAGAFNRSAEGLTAAPLTADLLRGLADRYADDLTDVESLTGLGTAGWSTRRILDGSLDPAELAERLNRKAGLLG